jgi:hypothetical protein
MEKNLLG